MAKKIFKKTKKQNSENSNEKNNQLYFNLVENAQDLFWQCDIKGRYIYLNKTWKKTLGYSIEEMLNKSFSDFMDKKMSKKELTLFRKILKKNNIVKDYITTNINKDGSKVYLSYNAAYIKDKNGKIQGVQGSARDITSLKETEIKLNENEKKFHSLFNNAAEGIALHEVVFDKKNKPVNYRIIDVNPQYEIVTGLKKKNISGKLATEVYNQSEVPYLTEFTGVAITGKPNYLETYYPPMKKHFSISIAPWGEKGFATIFTDITEKKKTDEELIKRSDELDRYFNVSLDLLCIADIEGSFKKLNSEWERTLGWTVDELIGKSFLSLVHPDDLETTLNAVGDLKNQRSVLNFINRYKCKDGTYKWIEWRSIPSGNTIYAVARDVSSRVIIEEELKKNESLLKESQKIAGLGHYIFHIKSGDWIGSEGLYEIFGINENFKKNIEGWLLIIHPDDREEMKNYLLTHVISKKNKFDKEYRVIRFNDKKIRWMHGLGNLKFNDKGDAVEMFGTIQDITEKRQSEDELKKTSEKLKIINSELEQILYVFSHDLRSPLINIEGFSNELNYSIGKIRYFIENLALPEDKLTEINKIFNENIKDAFHFISLSTIKMDSLLKGFLKLFRLGMSNIEVKKIDMNKMLSNLIKTFEYQIKKDSIEIIIENINDCYGDEIQINQLFSNLIGNAIKYREESRKSYIKINSIKKNKMIIYCVEDNGIGIAPDYQEKIFEIFYRLNPNVKDGDGLGLSIAEKIVKKHNGNIKIESEYGKGAKFFVELPF